MNHDQEAAIVRAFIENLGEGPHSGTTAFIAFSQIQRERVHLFEGLPGDPWQQVHALLKRRGVARG